jgi:hypothetical protein
MAFNKTLRNALFISREIFIREKGDRLKMKIISHTKARRHEGWRTGNDPKHTFLAANARISRMRAAVLQIF